MARAFDFVKGKSGISTQRAQISQRRKSRKGTEKDRRRDESGKRGKHLTQRDTETEGTEKKKLTADS